jgi:hypothetical protein
MVFSIERGAAHGILSAANKAILDLTAHPEALVNFIDGRQKVVVIEWNGDPGDGSDLQRFDQSRGDGDWAILSSGDDGYCVPEGITDFRLGEKGEHNWRLSVPLWLLNAQPDCEENYTLAVGFLHPLFSSATLCFYDWKTGNFIAQVYLCDPRYPRQKGDRWIDNAVKKQVSYIAARGGSIKAAPAQAPCYGDTED